jgi:hypothetical protein
VLEGEAEHSVTAVRSIRNLTCSQTTRETYCEFDADLGAKARVSIVPDEDGAELRLRAGSRFDR